MYVLRCMLTLTSPAPSRPDPHIAFTPSPSLLAHRILFVDKKVVSSTSTKLCAMTGVAMPGVARTGVAMTGGASVGSHPRPHVRVWAPRRSARPSPSHWSTSVRVDENSPGVLVSVPRSRPGSTPTDPTLSLLILIQLDMCVECGW